MDNDLLASIFGNAVLPQPNYPTGTFTNPDLYKYANDAYNALKPYYQQLLTEAGGDMEIALQNLEKDYQVGKRTTLEDFQSSMDTLGLTMKDEQTKNEGNMNQRGFALTENPQGQTQLAGGGLAKTQTENLNSSQNLRQEAIQRTQQRGMQDAAIKKLTGTESTQQTFRNTAEANNSAQQQSAASIGSSEYSAQLANQQSQQNTAENNATYGTGSSGSSVNPNDANSIKSAFKGYQGWNDTAAILADYKATGGAGKS